jgi:phosphoenolpyruvate carboxykinase (ATP)
MGIENAKIHYQLPTHDMTAGQGIETSGALAINTGEYTGRSDRFIVKDSITEDQVWWGK